MNVSVAQEDIDNCDPGHSFWNPVSRSLRRIYPTADIAVMPYLQIIRINDQRFSMDKNTSDWLVRYGLHQKVKPFDFELGEAST